MLNSCKKCFSKLTEKCYVEAKLDVENLYIPSFKDMIFKVKLFSNKLKILTIQSQQILAPSGISDINIQSFADRELFDRCAYRLREIVKSAKITKLPNDITASDIIKGECENVPELQYFFEKLLTGYNTHRKASDTDICRATTLASDALFRIHHGRVLPPHHISLAMTVKCMSTNKTLITLMNRLGHTINYSKLLEIETQLADSSLRRSQLCPENIALRNNLHTGVSFDNFDRFVETLDAKHTLHDTQFIVYQDTSEHTVLSQEEPVNENCRLGTSRKRRSLEDTVIGEIQPYPKRIKLLEQVKSKTVPTPDKYYDYRKLDAAWIISIAAGIKTPMWVGYNAQLCEDSSPLQVIGYLPPINETPTNVNVVVESLRRCIKVADECN